MLDTKEVKLKLGEYEGNLNCDLVNNLVKTKNIVECTIGLDMGSTGNRLRPYSVSVESDDMDDMFGNTVEINSDLGIVGDIDHIRSASNKIYDNMEFVLKDVTEPDKKGSKMFNEIHFVKYGLFNSLSTQELSRPSKVSKVDLDATYINAIATVAMDIYYNALNTGKYHSCYHIVPAVTLPPEDFKSQLIINKFIKRLSGHYEVSLPRLGVVFNILIKDSDIFTDKEPNAVVYNLATAYDQIMDVTSVIVDGGGKSTDVSLVVDGVLQEKGSDTISYGGSRLLDDIVTEYVRETGKSEPPISAVLGALDNGILVRGNKNEDIFNVIDKAKDNMANYIFNDLLKIFDRARIAMDDIGFFAFHGRLFADTTLVKLEDGSTLVSSIALKLEALIGKLNSDIETCTETDTKTIATGVIISRLVSESE